MSPVFHFERLSYGPAYKEKNINYIYYIYLNFIELQKVEILTR